MLGTGGGVQHTLRLLLAGVIVGMVLGALSSLAPGERSRLVRISEVAEHEVPDLLQFLGTSGFTLGGEIEMVETSRGAGTISVRVGKRVVSMASAVAGKVWVAV